MAAWRCGDGSPAPWVVSLGGSGGVQQLVSGALGLVIAASVIVIQRDLSFQDQQGSRVPSIRYTFPDGTSSATGIRCSSAAAVAGTSVLTVRCEIARINAANRSPSRAEEQVRRFTRPDRESVVRGMSGRPVCDAM